MKYDGTEEVPEALLAISFINKTVHRHFTVLFVF